MRSLIDIATLSVAEIDELIATAYDIIENFKTKSENEIVNLITEKYGVSKQEVLECIEDVKSLKEQGKLFTEDAYENLGLEEAPFVKNGKLNIRCTKNGSAKISISAIAGGDTVAGQGLSVIGGTEFTREISVLSRNGGVAENGGWL